MKLNISSLTSNTIMPKQAKYIPDDLLEKHGFTRDEYDQAVVIMLRIRKMKVELSTRKTELEVVKKKEELAKQEVVRKQKVARKREWPLLVCPTCGAFVKCSMKRHNNTMKCKRDSATRSMEAMIPDYAH